jgi:SAM-dependent methyltransferase
MGNGRGDGWQGAATYEDFMGRWSRPLAGEFLEWLDAPAGGHWLDVGTGTGALATAICSNASPGSVVACDPSEPFVQVARLGSADPRISFVVGGIGSLPERPEGYDAIVSGLALNFFSDAPAAVQEQLTRLRAGGCLGAYVWDYAEGMEFLRHFWDAAISVAPDRADSDEARRFPICAPEPLRALFEAGGMERVTVSPIAVPTSFADFEDYWRPFLGGTGPAPSLVSALSEEQRGDLAGRLRSRLAPDGGGAVRLRARAWAVRGYKVG